jgi:hypothetical protein
MWTSTVSEMCSEHQMMNIVIKAQYSFLYRIYVILFNSQLEMARKIRRRRLKKRWRQRKVESEQPCIMHQ